MFPIFTSPTRLVGFGGRALGDDEPKYLNSPESPLFDKGRTLFGMPQASEAARRRNRLIVCEGYMDVVMLSQAGFAESAAAMGTAATAAQMARAARAADNIVFAFDGDDAGRAAAWRAAEGILPALRDGKGVSFLFLPRGEDPDSLIQKRGADAFEKLLASAKPLGEYAAAHLLESAGAETDEGRRSAAARAGAMFLAKVRVDNAPFLRGILQKTLAETIGVDPKLLDRESHSQAQSQMQSGAMSDGGSGMPPRMRGTFRMREGGMLFELLCCLVAKPELAAELEESPPPLLGASGEPELANLALSRLRFRNPDGGGESGGADDGDDSETADVPSLLEREGYAAAAKQLRHGAKRFARADVRPDDDFRNVVESLRRKHLEKTGAGKKAWLQKIRADANDT